MGRLEVVAGGRERIEAGEEVIRMEHRLLVSDRGARGEWNWEEVDKEQ